MSADATLRMKHWCDKHGLRTFDCGCEKTVQEVMTVAKTKTKPGDVVFKSGNGRELLRLGGDGGFWVEGILLPYVDGDAIAMGLGAFLKASGFGGKILAGNVGNQRARQFDNLRACTILANHARHDIERCQRAINPGGNP